MTHRVGRLVLLLMLVSLPGMGALFYLYLLYRFICMGGAC